MSETPAELRFLSTHEWARLEEDGSVTVGISDHAQDALGDVVFVELPEEGGTFEAMEPFGTIEAVKAVSDLYCPVKGEVVEVNASLADDPSLVNSDPYGAGWMIRLKLADEDSLSGLLDSAGYAVHVGED